MTYAKVLFSAGALVFHVLFFWGVGTIWLALPWWAFTLALTLYLPPATWLLYLAGMAINRAEVQAHALPELAAFLSRLFWPLAAAHNLLNNVLPMTLAFGFDPPLELATTKRLNRYADSDGDHWRKRLALAVREQLLNVFDWRGVHT